MHLTVSRLQLPLWAAALWWGSLGTLGFLVVPLLFVHLPTPGMAGTMAARLFTAQTWVSMACGLLLLLAGRSHESQQGSKLSQAGLAFVMSGMLLALLLEFAVSPRIAARENLAFWHRVGSGLYLLQWLCAGVVLWKLSRLRRGSDQV